MSDTPPASEFGDRNGYSVRVFGGKFVDLAHGIMVKSNIHEQAPVKAVTTAFGRVEILKLSVTVVPKPSVMGAMLQVNVGWGHCEHTLPTSLADLAQLPVFEALTFVSGVGVTGQNAHVDCVFGGAINPVIKPVMLEGGRPSVYFYATAVGSDGKPVAGGIAQVFFRLSVRVSGSDIVFA